MDQKWVRTSFVFLLHSTLESLFANEAVSESPESKVRCGLPKRQGFLAAPAQQPFLKELKDCQAWRLECLGGRHVQLEFYIHSMLDHSPHYTFKCISRRLI